MVTYVFEKLEKDIIKIKKIKKNEKYRLPTFSPFPQSF